MSITVLKPTFPLFILQCESKTLSLNRSMKDTNQIYVKNFKEVNLSNKMVGMKNM